MPWGCLRFVIVVFPDHTHLLFWGFVAKTVRISRWWLLQTGYIEINPDSLNETTMKQQITSITDYISVCLFQITGTCGIKGLTLKGNAVSSK